MPPRKRKGDGDKAQGLRELRERQYEERQAAPPAKAEPRTLADHDAIIDRGKSAFLEVAASLVAVKDGQLWIGHHESYEAWCLHRHGFSLRRGRQLLQAAEGVAALTKGKHVSSVMTPGNARQAAELAPLAKTDPALAQEAWDEASADGKPTAAKVRAAVKARTVEFTDGFNTPGPEPEVFVGHDPGAKEGDYSVTVTGYRDEDGTITITDEVVSVAVEVEPLSHDDLAAMREREVAAQGEANVEYAEQRATVPPGTDPLPWSPERQAIEDIALEMGLPPSVPLATLQRAPSQSGDRFVRELRRGVHDLLSKLAHPEMQGAIAAGLVLVDEERASLVMQVEHLRDYLTKVSEALSEDYTADADHFVDMAAVR